MGNDNRVNVCGETAGFDQQIGTGALRDRVPCLGHVTKRAGSALWNFWSATSSCVAGYIDHARTGLRQFRHDVPNGLVGAFRHFAEQEGYIIPQ
jgi:hypothetical protein